MRLKFCGGRRASSRYCHDACDTPEHGRFRLKRPCSGFVDCIARSAESRFSLFLIVLQAPYAAVRIRQKQEDRIGTSAQAIAMSSRALHHLAGNRRYVGAGLVEQIACRRRRGERRIEVTGLGFRRRDIAARRTGDRPGIAHHRRGDAEELRVGRQRRCDDAFHRPKRIRTCIRQRQVRGREQGRDETAWLAVAGPGGDIPADPRGGGASQLRGQAHTYARGTGAGRAPAGRTWQLHGDVEEAKNLEEAIARIEGSWRHSKGSQSRRRRWSAMPDRPRSVRQRRAAVMSNQRTCRQSRPGPSRATSCLTKAPSFAAGSFVFMPEITR